MLYVLDSSRPPRPLDTCDRRGGRDESRPYRKIIPSRSIDIAALDISQPENAIDDGLDIVAIGKNDILVGPYGWIVNGGEVAVVLAALTWTQGDALNGSI